jgi:hypothetical protein
VFQYPNQMEADLLLSRIAEIQARAGYLDAAIATATQVRVRPWQDKALAEVAVIQARACDFQAALATVGRLREAFWRAIALARVGAAQAAAGAETEARRSFAVAGASVQAEPNSLMRTQVLAEIAEAQAVAELHPEAGVSLAAALTSGLEEMVMDPEVEEMIANSLARTRDFAQVTAIVRERTEGPKRARLLAMIATVQAKTGATTAARATAAEAEAIVDEEPSKDFRGRGAALRDIAAARVLANDVVGAIATARSVPDPYFRAGALAKVAAALAQAGSISEAHPLFAEAVATASEETDPESRAQALRQIAVAQASNHDFAGALATARDVPGGGMRSYVLMEIAIEQARAGDLAEAIRTSGGMLAGLDHRLPPIAEAVVGSGADDELVRRSFGELLLAASAFPTAAREMCESLAQLYPSQAPAIVGIILQDRDERAARERGDRS